jgi:vitamin-K-epoxide reductase (warfarin-sensitive)
MMSARSIPIIICILALAGIGVSSLSLYHHYAKSKTAYCDFGESFNCDIVNRSEHSSIAGIPVAGIGIFGYAVVLLLSTVFRENRDTPGMLTAGALAGVAFALYLTYVEAFLLHAYCILCLSSLLIIILIASFSATWLYSSRRTS